MARILGPEMLLGTKLTANYLNVSIYQLRYAVENGRITPTKIIKTTGGRTRRKFSIEDLDEIKKRVWDDQEVIRERILREEAFHYRWDKEINEDDIC